MPDAPPVPDTPPLLQVLDAEGKVRGPIPRNLTKDDLRTLYRAMVQTRLFDQRGLNLQRQGRIGFFVPGAGQEASQVGAGFAIRPGDWIYPSYRMHSVALLLGVEVRALFDQMWGNGRDVGHGRQMPNHFSFRAIHWVSISSPIGTQISQATGTARAAQLRGDDAVTWAWFGDGGTSSNDFHAGLNFAGVWRVPAVFVCENNHWAISVPETKQTASSSFAAKAQAYGIRGVRVDGNDVLAVVQAAQEAREWAAAGNGPTLLETVTFRMGPHSSSDDPKRYQAPELFEAWQKKDPIDRFRAYLKGKRIWTKAWEEAFKTAFLAQVAEAVDDAENAPPPEVETLFEDVYARMPPALREERDGVLERIRADGEIEDAGGAFPL
ncbi:MAG: thiamine pyrophosphate-dependent dehydrogenase E1 component subunit alpha [Planctomycetota bacterium]